MDKDAKERFLLGLLDSVDKRLITTTSTPSWWSAYVRESWIHGPIENHYPRVIPQDTPDDSDGD